MSVWILVRSFYSAGFGQSIIEMLGLLLFSLGYLSVECLFVLVLCFFFFYLHKETNLLAHWLLIALLYDGLLIVEKKLWSYKPIWHLWLTVWHLTWFVCFLIIYAIFLKLGKRGENPQTLRAAAYGTETFVSC